jgi:hypothetical protein
MHIHIGRISSNKSLPLARVLRSGDLDGSGRLPKGCVSSDRRAPSVRIVKVHLTNEDIMFNFSYSDVQLQQGLQGLPRQVKTARTTEHNRRGVKVPVVLISVFVAAESTADIVTKVRPFETTRAAAAAVRHAAGAPYVLMLTAHRQLLQGCDTAAVAASSKAATASAAASSLQIHEHKV